MHQCPRLPLLPKYRGAAPIEWAIVSGEKQTGVTTMYTAYELDAGDMLEKDSVEIGENETGGELRERLSVLGAKTLKRTLEKLLAGTLVRTPQKERRRPPIIPCFSGILARWIFRIWRKTWRTKSGASTLRPWPISWQADRRSNCSWPGTRESMGAHAPGEILAADPKAGLVIQAGDLPLEIITLQYPGKKPMAARDFLQGNSGIQSGRNRTAIKGKARPGKRQGLLIFRAAVESAAEPGKTAPGAAISRETRKGELCAGQHEMRRPPHYKRGGGKAAIST